MFWVTLRDNAVSCSMHELRQQWTICY